MNHNRHRGRVYEAGKHALLRQVVVGWNRTTTKCGEMIDGNESPH